jgi:hypothetical protein
LRLLALLLASAGILSAHTAFWFLTQLADVPTSCRISYCSIEGLTISVDTTQQVLVQAHLVEGLEGLLPLGEESLTTITALGSAHAAKRKQAQNMAGV